MKNKLVDLMKRGGGMAAFVVWLSLTIYAWEAKAMRDEVMPSAHSLTRRDLVPKWMPQRWTIKFLEKIGYSTFDAMFSQELNELQADLESADWIREVRKIRRVYSGDMQLSVEVRKPVCVLANGSSYRYLSSDLMELDVFGTSPQRLEQGDIPVVDVSRVVQLQQEYREKSLEELLSFIREWTSRQKLANAFALREIEMVSAGRGKECQLKLNLQDNRFNQKVEVWWGVHREYNALEDRRSREKWSDMYAAMEQKRPFSVLELRYRPPQSSY